MSFKKIKKLFFYIWDILIGSYSILFGRKYLREMFFSQVYFYTVNSIFLVSVTALFFGAVLTIQLIPELGRFGAEDMIGSLINIAMSRELGPIILGVILAGRLGASMTAELGSMNTTNQIDYLRLMAVNPVRYLVAPKVLATFIIFPFLAMLSTTIIFFTSMFITTNYSDVAMGDFVKITASFLEMKDILGGVIKTAFFGMAISCISCYKGIYVKGKSSDISKAITESVALSIIGVIVLNLLLSYLIFL